MLLNLQASKLSTTFECSHYSSTCYILAMALYCVWLVCAVYVCVVW